MKTGWFGREHRNTQVHILKQNGVCLCGYRPHKTMKFQWCANGVHLPYVECDRCGNRFLDYLNK